MMYKYIVVITMISMSMPFSRTTSADSYMSVSELLDKYAANQDKLRSWIIMSEQTGEGLRQIPKAKWNLDKRRCEVRFDGKRSSSRCFSRDKPVSGEGPIPKDRATYLSLLWDGEAYINYARSSGDDPGYVFINKNARNWDIQALQYGHSGCFLMGVYYESTFKRIDAILREARKISMRDTKERINGVDCHVIEAKTKYGNYTVWMDPEHGYTIARMYMRLSQDENHIVHGKPLKDRSVFLSLENVRFAKIDDVWLTVEGDVHSRRIYANGHVSGSRMHQRLFDINLNPDHDALGSFIPDDIQNGALVLQPPVTHIAYRWRNGAPVPWFDEEVVGRIDGVLEKIMADVTHELVIAEVEQDMPPEIEPIPKELQSSDQEQAEQSHGEQDPSEAASAKPLRFRIQCGLYCLYSILRLHDRQLGFHELVKPEYLGSRKGSTLGELEDAVTNYGLHGGTVARLTTRALRKCPYPAILHVKSSSESKEYDHYELFLGTENDKAKLFNPPEPPKLVSFKEVAPRWDGNALFISAEPFDLDLIFVADRQRLLMYGAAGVVVVLILHLGRRLWFALAGNLPRQWLIGLSVGQGAVLAVAALVCGMLYHFVDDEQGLLANTAATASLQKAHLGNFIPKVSEKKVHKLLDTDTVFIDARMSLDYEAGHLEGAISLPVDANDIERQKKTTDITKDSPLIVYCQSAECKFAENVAVKLVEDGFSNISIFRGGWREWVTKNSTPPKKHIW